MAEQQTNQAQVIKLPPASDFSPSPPEEKEALVSIIRAVFRAESFSGPLPSPEILAGYEKVLPGAANRIIKMAENQAKHRQDIEKSVIESDGQRAKLGVASAFVLSLTAILGGVIAVCLDHGASGSIISTTGVVALAGTFIYGTITRRNERIEKTKMMTGSKSPEVTAVATVPSSGEK